MATPTDRLWNWRVLERGSDGTDHWEPFPGAMTVAEAQEWVRKHGKHLARVEEPEAPYGE